MQDGELRGPGHVSLREPRDLLGIGRALLHARTRVGLLVPCPVKGALRVDDLDLEALPGVGLLRDRPEGVEGGGLLLDLECGRITLEVQPLHAAHRR